MQNFMDLCVHVHTDDVHYHLMFKQTLLTFDVTAAKLVSTPATWVAVTGRCRRSGP